MTDDAPDPGAVESPRRTDTTPSPLDPTAVAPGTSVLVAGPAMTGKRRLAFQLLGGSASRTGCLVTTKARAQRVRSWVEAVVGDTSDWDLSVVDCVAQSTSFGERETEPDVAYVSSPADLTGIGIELTRLFSGWHADAVRDPRLAVHSLSTLLMYASLKQVYRFLYVVTGRLRVVDGVGAYTLDTNTGSSEVLDTLTQVFDALVEVRDEGERPEVRVRGADFGPQAWTPF
ncbi:RAD55 family ATPase [Halobaculum sp. MBLA0147]|uniref:RAD55 family ATPase n=1 Tax=Halobaculum sp. MBLA0147 TaxID=3079934 RepID=UPI0035240158